MVTRNADPSQGDGGLASTPPAPADQLRSRVGNMVFKSGPLFISSKGGMGWTSWKKRWFILTRTSLVFFRSDPNAIPQKGSEVNLTLGGIDLNNSGSVVVKADKKLLSVLFPDGRDGRGFTLKAETSEDLHEWKTALENALAQAPSAALVMGQNGIFRNDPADAVDDSLELSRDRRLVKSVVVGRPILLALEDIDGAPSFLEKALRFLEQYGVKVEGILRQAADVDDVERRVREYEQGKLEFSPEEDPHVIADCVKHVLRELPSSPVPASCCNALLEAFRTDRGVRVNAMRAAISETFPEPNRRLLQRVLTMMQTVASHKSENRMSLSAVAACMAPLLLRPLLAGDCELENDFDMGGDGSVQLLQAAAAANHAQAIVITLLEEYNNIFGEGSISPELYSDSEESGYENEEPTDDDEVLEDDGYHDAELDLDADTDDDSEHALSGTCSEGSVTGDADLYNNKVSEGSDSDTKSPEVGEDFEDNQKPSSTPQTSFSQHESLQISQNQSNSCSAVHASESCESLRNVPAATNPMHTSTGDSPSPCITKSTNKSSEPGPRAKRPTVWGRTSAKKNLSMEYIDCPIEDEPIPRAIEKLESTKTDLQNRIAKEAKGNAILQASLEQRKQALHKRRLALEQDVARLQEQLQREKDLRETLEAGLNIPLGYLPVSATIDEKTKAELEEIALAEADVINLKQRIDDLHVQLNQQREQNKGSVCESCNRHQQSSNHQATLKEGTQKKNVETTATSHLDERSKRIKDANLGVDNKNVRKQELPSLPNKQPPQKQQLDLADYNSPNSDGVPATSSAEAVVVVGPTASSNSKKSGARGEENISTPSALTKLTTRLNFLKERRTQIANEIQNPDKGRGSESQSLQNMDKSRGSEDQSLQNLDKGRGAEGQSLQNPDKDRGAAGQSLKNLDKGRASGQSVQNPDKDRGAAGQSLKNLDKGRASGQSVQNLDKSRGSDQSLRNLDKGQASEDQSFCTLPRTISR